MEKAGNGMALEDRKKQILEKLKTSSIPISASALGKQFAVSRQVIVTDIALLRASGENISATPRGYIIELPIEEEYIIACSHGIEDLKEELYTIVDGGCSVMDVVVEHEIYGQLSAKLCIHSRSDVEEFIHKLENSQTQPLCSITNNYHFHTLHCPSKEHFEKVKILLQEKGICL